MNSEQKPSDDQLTAMLAGGSKAAFETVYSRYWKVLYNEAYRRLRDQPICEEIVQDVFIDLWNKRDSREIASLYPYLLAAVRYKVFALYHKSRSQPVFEAPLEYIASSSYDADAGYLNEELVTAVKIWLSGQPEKRREIFRLRYLEGMSTQEIADQLHIARKTVQNQLNFSKQDLRDDLSRFMFLVLLLLPIDWF